MSDKSNIEWRLRAVEPAVRLVSERHLLKLLTYLRDRDHVVPLNPDLPLWIERSVLIESAILPTLDLVGLDDQVLLVANPASLAIDHLAPDEQLRTYWRILFQAAIVKELVRQLADGRLDGGEQLAKFGAAAVREIQYVLESDHATERNVGDDFLYRAFAATALDLIYFAPKSFSAFFPTLPPIDDVLSILHEHLDAQRLHVQSRPEGASEAIRAELSTGGEGELPSLATAKATQPDVVETREEEQKGNFVRAAIRFVRIGMHAEANASIERLVGALASVLQWNDAECSSWKHSLVPMLHSAASGEWPLAARCLYELQKIPRDAGREVFAVDLVEPIRTLGRRPVKRPLPHARVVILLMHLKAAYRQLLRSRITPTTQLALRHLLHDEIERSEHRVRREIAPVLVSSLAAAGWVAEVCVEIVARDKIVAELLDRICNRGVLRIGDLRDAIARNQLKMPDLLVPGEFIRGDLLLRADTQLTYDLDGVYRRGELYLRALQRSNSIFFGTQIGRLLFLYLILPFVAAFMTVVFTQELVHLGGKAHHFASKILAPRGPVRSSVPAAITPETRDEVGADDVEVDPETGEIVIDADAGIQVAKVAVSSSAAETHEEFSIPWEYVGPLTLVFLLLLHVPIVRVLLIRLLTFLWIVIKLIVWSVPLRIWHSAPMKALRHSGVMRFVHHYLTSAIVLTALVVTMMAGLGAPWRQLLKWGGIVFAATTVLVNTGWGWVVQERIAARLDDAIRLLRVNLIPGFISWCIWAFRWLANWIERQLYRVDEWLRFRGGDSSGSLVWKALLGLLWFPIEYVLRFAFYLLLEPQINPVKHFPVVTVSHKVILPMFPAVADVLQVSENTAFIMVGCVPGVFGFIAWELMANWRLYRANRPLRLRPVVIGSHGESMRGMLRPGFHSGTVPKLYRKLRKAHRRADPFVVARIEHELEHAAAEIHRFIERELLVLLNRTGNWPISLEREFTVRFGCQRVQIELPAQKIHEEPFAFALENRHGTIEGTIIQMGWLNTLHESHRTLFLAAMRGIFDMAAADTFDGTPREPDAEILLAKPWTWADWVDAWEVKKLAAATTSQP